MQNLRMFQITFLGPTNTKGSRVKITDLRFRKSIILSKSYEYNSITDQAKVFLESKGIKVIAQGEGDKRSDFLMSDNFQEQIKG